MNRNAHDIVCQVTATARVIGYRVRATIRFGQRILTRLQNSFLMRKMEAESFADLVNMATRLRLTQSPKVKAPTVL